MIHITAGITVPLYGTMVLTLLGKMALSGETILEKRDSVLPYHDEVDSACRNWLVMLVSEVYEQCPEGSKRQSLDGIMRTKQEMAVLYQGAGGPDVTSDVVEQEWSLSGRRSFKIAFVMPDVDPARSFPGHNTVFAAAFLASSFVVKVRKHLREIGTDG